MIEGARFFKPYGLSTCSNAPIWRAETDLHPQLSVISRQLRESAKA
jgi:hypothetical protein